MRARDDADARFLALVNSWISNWRSGSLAFNLWRRAMTVWILGLNSKNRRFFVD